MGENIYRKPDFGELPVTEQLAIKIEEAARELDVHDRFAPGFPSRQFAIDVMDVLRALKGIDTVEKRNKILKERGVMSLAELRFDSDRYQAAVVIWNPNGSSFMENKDGKTELCPHLISLIRTDFRQDIAEKDKVYVPVLQFPIAYVAVGGTHLDFDPQKLSRFRGGCGIHKNSRMMVGKTFIG